MEIDYLKIIKCEYLDFFFLDSVSHSWGVPTMKITDLSILVSGKPWKIDSVSNTYFRHYKCILILFF